MRKIVILIMAGIFLLAACGQQENQPSSGSETTPSPVTPSVSSTHSETETIPVSTTYPFYSDPLEENELCLISDKKTWRLGEPIRKEEIPDSEETLPSKSDLRAYFIQRGPDDRVTYLLYKWPESGITVAACNLYYDLSGKDEDSFYFNYVSTTDTQFKTTRSIRVGDTLAKVKKQYGFGGEFKYPLVGRGIVYYLDGTDTSHQISFFLDEKDTVTRITVGYWPRWQEDNTLQSYANHEEDKETPFLWM